MADSTTAMPTIRAMTALDLDRIAEIDKQVMGQSRPGYWKLKLELADKRSPMFSLVAELEGKVIGFVIGDARGWEYSVAENIGWIDTIGVDPDYQRQGIAKMLMTEIINNLKKEGVEKIYTFVSWRDWNLLRFFDASGFRKGDMINLEMEI